VRRSVVILLATVVVVAMLIGIWRYVRPLGGAEQLTLTSVEGQVTLVQPGRGAGEAVVGRTLVAEDQLQTAVGRAVLELEGGTRVRVGPSSNLLVVGVDDNGLQLELDGGALKATVRPESGALAVTGAGITAQATDADFAFGMSDDLVVLESTRGDVGVMGADIGRVVEGSRAVIASRAASVGPIPSDLLLSVEWPEARRTREETGAVAGRTAPGATVTVRGPTGVQEVTADQEGAFLAIVPLTEGENPVEIEARDVFGEETHAEGVLQVRVTAPPTLKSGVEYPR
jgi:hypothetical protein